MTNKFEEFLQEIHAKDYTGTDDDMIKSFDEWLGCLDIDDWLKYGILFGDKIAKEIKDVAHMP